MWGLIDHVGVTNRIVVRGNQYGTSLRYGTVQVHGKPCHARLRRGRGSRGKVGKTFFHPLTFVRMFIFYLMGLFANNRQSGLCKSGIMWEGPFIRS